MVEIIHTNDCYQLYVGFTSRFISEVPVWNPGKTRKNWWSMEAIPSCTWRTEGGQMSGRQMLDRAFTNGLYVTMGLEIGRERQGFDYNDKAAVARQLEGVKKEVLKYKDHPALIIWAIGNELNLNARNPRVWDAVNDISKMIHQIDPNHLTTTPLSGFNKEVVQQVKTRAPDLDLLSFQMYADIVNLPRYLRESDWNGPYMITEWGATGHWEVGKTAWGAPIENDSTVKANAYKKRFETVIGADRKQCVGSYVFLWGHKQERTPTWYGMFLESGEETPAVDVMQYLWTGAWPSPSLSAILKVHGWTAGLHTKISISSQDRVIWRRFKSRITTIMPLHLSGM